MFRYSQYGLARLCSALGGGRSATVDSLVRKKDCTLEELLAEDDLVAEVTNQNSNVLNLYYFPNNQ